MMPFRKESTMSALTSPPGPQHENSSHWEPRLSDDEFQAAMLEGVSRTFALTIPQLPPALCRVVANAYLLCRIVDTIEDEPALSAARKQYFCDQFVKVVAEGRQAPAFCAELAASLSDQTIVAEHELIRNVPRVIRITHGFSREQRAALQHCIAIMARGMGQFQLRYGRLGLGTLDELDQYCYYVAGVVGQMLTSLFCLYSKEMAANRDSMMALAVSFGQGLQMTNILKDFWEDRARGACWLPRQIFAAEGFDLTEVGHARERAGFERGIRRLVGIAHRHLRNALAYTLLIPNREPGIRNFCLWAIGMALLTLRKLNKNLDYTDGRQVTISRRSVKTVVLATSISSRWDTALKVLFSIAAWRLPLAPAATGWSPPIENPAEGETGT